MAGYPTKAGYFTYLGRPPTPCRQKIDLFVTLFIVYIQISNAYLLEFLITSRLTLHKCVVNVCIQR